MTYLASETQCDWCKKWLENDDTIACGDCCTRYETQLAEAQEEIKRLKDRIAELEAEREE